MDFNQALTFQFKDSHWARKFLLMAFLSLIPIFGQVVVFGWSLEITRRVIQSETNLLPDLDLSNDLLRGLKAWGIGLIYLIPALLMAAPVAVGLGIMAVSANSRLAYDWILVGLCLVAALIGYGLVFVFALPAIYANYMAHGEAFQAGLKVREIYGLVWRNPAAYLLVMIGGFLCVFITFLGLAGCIIGVILTGLYTLTIMAHLYGQAYRITNRGTLSPG